jgi:hypothetical protein
MSRLTRKSVSPSALVTLVLGFALLLMVPAISAGVPNAEPTPRLSIIIHGTGGGYYKTTYVGNRSAACRAGRPVDATVTIGGGKAGNTLIVGQAFCNKFSVARSGSAIDPGTGAFVSSGPQTGTQRSGPPLCIGKYDPDNSQPASAWVAVCRFF